MKKELAALLLLAAIVCVSVWNTRHLRLLLDELESQAEAADTAAAEARWSDAADAAEALLQRLEAAKHYSQVFLRHPDIETTVDALCALRGAVLSQDADACRTAVFNLRMRLNGIREAETPGLGSVF